MRGGWSRSEAPWVADNTGEAGAFRSGIAAGAGAVVVVSDRADRTARLGALLGVNHHRDTSYRPGYQRPIDNRVAANPGRRAHIRGTGRIGIGNRNFMEYRIGNRDLAEQGGQ